MQNSLLGQPVSTCPKDKSKYVNLHWNFIFNVSIKR